MLKRALVIGASSGMGAELVRRLVADGCLVGAVARRADRLEALARAIDGEGPRRVFPYAHDVRRAEEAGPLFERVVRELDGLDLVIYAAGVMPRVGPQDYDVAVDREIVETNLIGAMAWLNPAAERFSRLRGGAIVGIGSVAGDRGRLGNPAYGASKAALHAYLESLRYRLRGAGVQVLTVKPGPVRTPMTEGLDRLPLVVDAEVAVDGILSALHRGADVAYVPRRWAPIMAVVRSIPGRVFHRTGL